MSSITGTAGNDSLIGTELDDTIDGMGGADTLSGRGGNDLLVAAAGLRAARGGAGEDTLDNSGGVNLSAAIIDGVEILSGGGAFTHHQLNSFERFEDIRALQQTTAGEVDLRGRIESLAPDQTFLNYRGSDGTDRIVLSDAEFNILLNVGGGDDWAETGSGNDILFANRQFDFGSGSEGVTLSAGDGHDRIEGGNNGDILIGGTSAFDMSDTIEGDDGADEIHGGAGNDLLYGGSAGDQWDVGGDDTIYGGAGSDTIEGGLYHDLIYGDDGQGGADFGDVINGGSGRDTIYGGAGNDYLQGGGQAGDRVHGGTGSDTLIGSSGGDTLAGGQGSDAIYAGQGDDFIAGGAGNDRLHGGMGSDRFHHSGMSHHGTDWIADYLVEDPVEGLIFDRDVLSFAGVGTADDFSVTFRDAGAGDAAIQEAFVVHEPSGQTLWALVDGAAQESILLSVGGTEYDLLA